MLFCFLILFTAIRLKRSRLWQNHEQQKADRHEMQDLLVQ